MLIQIKKRPAWAWVVNIRSPLGPIAIYDSFFCMSRAEAIARVFAPPFMPNADMLIQIIKMPTWATYFPVTATETRIVPTGLGLADTIFKHYMANPIVGSFFIDTTVIGKANVNIVTWEKYDLSKRGGYPVVYGLNRSPFFVWVDELIPVKLRLTYTPVPQIHDGEMFDFGLVAIDDIYGNHLFEPVVDPTHPPAPVEWTDVIGDRSAPYVVDFFPPHNAILEDTLSPIWIQFGDLFSAVNPHTIRMKIVSTTNVVVIDSMPAFPWPLGYDWDVEHQLFTFDPAGFGIHWVQGDTVTVYFYDIADSADYCGSNQYADEHEILTWTFLLIDGPHITNIYPTNGSFTACRNQQIGFTLTDPDGIDETSVVFSFEGLLYDITTVETTTVCHWIHIGDDSILVGCVDSIYNPLFYAGGGLFLFTPPNEYAVNARQIDCEIVAAEDALGNPMWFIGDYSWHFTYDFEGPLYFNPLPAPGSFAPGRDLVISIDLFDEICGKIDPSRLYFEINGSYYGPVPAGDYSWFDPELGRFFLDFGMAGVEFRDGETFEVCLSTAYDAPDYYCGVPNSATGLPYCWSFTIDNNPPTIELVEPLAGTVTACPSQPIKILLQDALGVDPTSPVMIVEGVLYTMTSPRMALYGDTLIFTPSTPWLDGQEVNFSLAQVFDIAGNGLTGSPLISMFTVDTQAPTLVSTMPMNGDVVFTDVSNIDVVVTDVSGLIPETATMGLTVTSGADTTYYNYTDADGFFTYSTIGENLMVTLDIVAGGVFIPSRGANFAVTFAIQDDPDYTCFTDPLVLGNELFYDFAFAVTPGWRVNLTLAPVVIGSDTIVPGTVDPSILTIGAAFGATDAYDAGIDVLMPPMPPDTTFPIYPPSLVEDTFNLVVDLKSLLSTTPSWMVWTGSTGGTLWWDSTSMPEYGSFVMRNGSGFFVDMRSTNFFVYEPGEGIYINFTPEMMTLYTGWNLVSVPVSPTDPTPSAVFGVPDYQIFWFNPLSRAFETPVAIIPGYAYFVLYVPDSTMPPVVSFSVPGTPAYDYTVIGIPEGWNTLGSVYDFAGVTVTDAAHVGTIPTPAIWGTGVYGYDPITESYFFSPEIVAGKGYWVYIDLAAGYTSCQISVSASWTKSAPYVDPLESYDIANLDVDGAKLQIALMENSTNSPDGALDRLIPPAIMGTTTNAYFTSNGLQLSRDVRPDAAWSLVLGKDSRITTDKSLEIDGLNYDGTFTLQSGNHKVGFAKANKLPTNVALFQNNPNPFNASTDISFDVPSKANVQLEVFNMLGQKVRTLLDGTVEAGHYSVNWNGADNNGKTVVSGVYFYKMTTNDLTTTKKMMLLK